SGRAANTCDCSKPGLMVPMARILVVGVVFIAAPCAFAELKPTRQPIGARAAARANFMLSLFCASLRRPGKPEACSQPSRPTSATTISPTLDTLPSNGETLSLALAPEITAHSAVALGRGLCRASTDSTHGILACPATWRCAIA